MLFIILAILSFSVATSLDLFLFASGLKGWRRFVSTFLLFYSQVLLTEFILGLLSILTGTNLVVVNLTIIFLLVLYVTRRYGASIFKKYALSIVQVIRSWMESCREDYLFLALLALSIAIIVWVIFLGLIFPVTDFDGNAYHMTFIAQAIQNHNIFDTATSLPWLTGYPKGGELIQLWNVIIPNNEALADLAQIPFLLLGLVALYQISLRLGVSKSDARFSSLLFLFLPVAVNQIKTTYVDVILCPLFFAALAMTTMKRISKFDLFIIGIIYSLLLSVKSTGLLFVLATVPFLLSNIIKLRGWKIVPDFREYIGKLLLVFLPTIFGFYWYIKDLIAYGSPLYPFGLTVFGTSIFPGKTFQDFIAKAFSNASVMPPGALHKVWFVWTEQQSWYGCLYNYDATFSGLGPVWFVLLLPAIPIGFIIAVRSRNYLYVAILAVLGILFLLYPANFYSRYTIFIVAIGVFSYGLLSTILGHKLKIFTRMIAISLAFSVISTNFTLCNFSPKVIRSQLDATVAGDTRGGLGYRNSIGSSYLFLQRRVKAKEVVVYDSKPYFIYALWKPDYSNKVMYLPSRSKGEWYSSVKRERAKYIFVNVISKEHNWIQEDKAFDRIFKDKMYEIYQVY